MRKLLLTLLLASAAATPALAGPNDDKSDRQAAREERQAQRAERQAERQAQAPAERPHVDAQRQFNGGGNGQQAVVQRQRMETAADQTEGLREGRRMRSGNGVQDNNWQQRRQQALQGQVQADETLRHSDRPIPNVLRTRTRTQVMTGVPAQGTQPPMRVDNHRRDRVRWNTNWRNDNRYDWRRWRNNHRSSFHLGFYIDPFGWNYQPYSIGYRLWPNYYSSNYWINDPWQYRLPYAPPGTQWIRYYNDALLVDMYTGQVVDAIPNFFW